MLGAGHAAEHARLRRAERTGQLAPAERASQASVQAAAALAGPPDQVGRWGAPFSIPSDGNPRGDAADRQGDVVLLSQEPSASYGGEGPRSPNTAQAWLWDPATGTHEACRSAVVARPGRRGAQAGQHLVLGTDLHRRRAAGGLRRQPALLGPGAPAGSTDFMGLNKVYTFNPWNESWTEQPDMRHGRWYPTAARMADGRIVVINGLDESGAGFQRNPDVELFTPAADLERARDRRACWARCPRLATSEWVASIRTCSRCRPGARWWRGRSPRTAGSSTRPDPRLLHLAGLPRHADRPALGHRGADAGRNRRLDPGHATRRLQPRPPPRRWPRPRSSTRQTRLGWLAGKVVDAASRAATTTPCSCPTARWSTVGGGVGVRDGEPVGR